MVLRNLKNIWRLMRTGLVLSRYRDLIPAQQKAVLPGPARLGLATAGLFAGKAKPDGDSPLTAALTDLGPTYIKLGQFLATRADIVGPELAGNLGELQDRMAPFAQADAEAEIVRSLGAPVGELFSAFGPAIAAASIAQVHKAKVEDGDGFSGEAAVKILRPDIEKRFSSDLDSFFFAARLGTWLSAPLRRLRPVDAVAMLKRSVDLEMDLRLEAAAISEMAENAAADPDFRVPRIDWQRTARRVLTCEWIDGIPLTNIAAIEAAGHDTNRLGDIVIQSFLRHAIRDGFFHADMHQGNLFVDAESRLVAVDFGIMGRLELKERRFLAEILYGFITRDYKRISDVHFDAGYVPSHQKAEVFAQALRAIGEPLMDRSADDISMARLLGQLFEVTEQFDMQTQPQLLLLQKTMVVVEGVARTLNPKLNMWETAEPVVRQWIEQKLGPQGRLEDAAEGAATLGKLVSTFPEALMEAQRTAHALSEMAEKGRLRLDGNVGETGGDEPLMSSFSTKLALWVGALALVVIALNQIFG